MIRTDITVGASRTLKIVKCRDADVQQLALLVRRDVFPRLVSALARESLRGRRLEIGDGAAVPRTKEL